jgi:hypothetical protein
MSRKTKTATAWAVAVMAAVTSLSIIAMPVRADEPPGCGEGRALLCKEDTTCILSLGVSVCHTRYYYFPSAED